MTVEQLPPPPDVAGVRLDGERIYRIDAGENAALCRSTGVEPAADGTAHPAYYYIATQVAMGKSVAELCTICAFDVNEGPMMAGSSVRFAAPLRVDVPYQVRGEILSLVRKRSRKLGVMDLLRYRLSLHGEDGAEVLETENSWVLPRKELA